MNKKWIVASFLVLTILGGFALGQEKKDVSLTLEDSIVQALKNNLNVAV